MTQDNMFSDVEDRFKERVQISRVIFRLLGVYSGTARVQLGGEGGMTHTIHPGDVIIIPAGVAHKNLGDSPDFGVVGAYPAGQQIKKVAF